MKPFLFSLLGLFIAFNVQAQKINLELNLKPQQVFHQKLSNQSTVIQTAMGTEMEIIMTNIADTEFRIIEANKDAFLIQVKYVDMVTEMEAANQKMSYKSSAPKENDPVSQMMANIIGKTFEMVLSKDGRVLEIRNTSVLWDGLEERLPDLSQDQIIALIEELKKQYGLEAFSSNMQLVTQIYPEEPIGIGETWNKNTQMINMITLNSQREFTLESIEGNVARVKSKTVISTPENSPTVKQQGIEMSYNLDGSQEGMILVDLNTGWILEANIVQDMSGEAKTKPNDQIPMEMTIPMKIKSVIVVED